MSLVGLQKDPSGLDMGHKFAKSQVLVVVGIRTHSKSEYLPPPRFSLLSV